MKTLFIMLQLIVLTGLSNDSKQEPDNSVLQITLMPRSGNEVLNKAEVTLMLGNKTLFTVLRPNHVKGFSFVLDRDTNYTLVIRAKGHVQRKISIDTHLPSNVGRNVIYRFEAMVEMPADNGLLDEEYIDFPVAMIEYHAGKDLFLHRVKYTENIKFLLTEEKPVIVRRGNDDTE